MVFLSPLLNEDSIGKFPLVLDNPWIKEEVIIINYFQVEFEARTRNYYTQILEKIQNTVLTSILKIPHLIVQSLGFLLDS